jgi:hypothetical protein
VSGFCRSICGGGPATPRVGREPRRDDADQRPEREAPAEHAREGEEDLRRRQALAQQEGADEDASDAEAQLMQRAVQRESATPGLEKKDVGGEYSSP